MSDFIAIFIILFLVVVSWYIWNDTKRLEQYKKRVSLLIDRELTSDEVEFCVVYYDNGIHVITAANILSGIPRSVLAIREQDLGDGV